MKKKIVLSLAKETIQVLQGQVTGADDPAISPPKWCTHTTSASCLGDC